MSCPDFERFWLRQFANCLTTVAGGEVRKKVMEGSETLSGSSGKKVIYEWTRQAMQRLERLVGEDERRDVMTSCACQYPRAELREAKAIFVQTGDIVRAHRQLQREFEAFLRESLKLDETVIADFVERGWGVAGRLDGREIIATKIPKSSSLTEYLQETDPVKKRVLYCHCPRIRGSIGTGVEIPTTYCYCGAGFYRGIWEYILGKPVRIELLQSVLKGDDVCQFMLTLPD